MALPPPYQPATALLPERWWDQVASTAPQPPDPAWPKVTVITPAYNCAATLEDSLRSVLGQDYPNLDYWVIDGGSTDGTLALLQHYAGNLTGWVSEPDRGIYDAMNKGIARVQTGWVYFLGGDDTLYGPQVIRDMVAAAAPDTDVLYGDVWRVPSGTRYDGPFDEAKLSSRNICHQAILYRWEVLQALGGYSLRYPVVADYALNIQAFARPEVRWQYVPLIVANYTETGTSSGGKLDLAFWADKETLFQALPRQAISRKGLYGSYGMYILHLCAHGQTGQGLRYLAKAIWYAGRWDLIPSTVATIKNTWQRQLFHSFSQAL